MARKMASKSARYEIELKCDKEQAFGVKLYSIKRNESVKEVLVHDATVLAQYNITLPQLNYLVAIEKMAGTPPYKVPCSFAKISKFKSPKPKRA